MNTSTDVKHRFDVNEGGPYVRLLQQLQLWRADKDTRLLRAAILVGFAWLIPLLLAANEGNAIGPADEGPFLFSLNAWARYFLGIGLFVLCERHVGQTLQDTLRRFFDAPIVTEGSRDRVAAIVAGALEARNSARAEAVILVLAVLTPLVTVQLASAAAPNSWIMSTGADGVQRLTWAGLWGIYVSGAIFFFLLYRWIWRMFIWSRLLSKFALLDLRLSVQHPDGAGGLGFVGTTPIAFAPIALIVGFWIAPVAAQLLRQGDLTINGFTALMAGWLVVVHAVLALPLWSFKDPLEALKEETLRTAAARATDSLHGPEQMFLKGAAPPEAGPERKFSPKALYAAANDMQTVLFSRSTILPVSVAALLPLAIAGATEFPFREVLGVLKKLVLF